MNRRVSDAIQICQVAGDDPAVAAHRAQEAMVAVLDSYVGAPSV